ncbi:phosphate transporter [Coccidioides immitis H538.4]|uniref:Phosphate transporter n=1 Tax=Coccidioides immitis H538.4 TaxID=396776 RepID=A0A0J8UAG4_COCIT|nr:phosphate transporter [Coccidioides immitis H538.4]
MTDFGPRAPHGPDMTGTHEPLQEMNLNEKEAFDRLIRPDDCYTSDGVYWADLPLLKRIGFVSSYDLKEAGREFCGFLKMFKNDPLSPVSYYFRNMVLPGAGLGLEGYVLFSIGNIKPLFEKSFPECWKTKEICNPTWIAAVEYLEICGIIVGQILVGILGDCKLYGRKWMQIIGFLMDFIFFIIPAYHFEYYTSPEHIHAFQAMYFLSSFFNQFGPNSVTFLVAAEVFPTPIRASAHGFAAAIGKLGALVAAVMYNYISTTQKFHVVPWFGLAGMVLTFLFLPDTTGLDLKEQERRWFYIRNGREHEYHGPAVHPSHLSLWERFRGVGKYYDADLDYKQKVKELREEWLASVARHTDEKPRPYDDGDLSEGLLQESVQRYFERTSPMIFAKEQFTSDFNKEGLENLPPPQAGSSEDISD